MGTIKCPSCGAPIPSNSVECKYCGGLVAEVNNPPYTEPQSEPQLQPISQAQAEPSVNASGKNKVVAGLLAILLGGFGIHKFYLGKIGWGIVYLLFFWTFIPAFIGFIEGIIYLVSSDESFNSKYN